MGHAGSERATSVAGSFNKRCVGATAIMICVMLLILMSYSTSNDAAIKVLISQIQTPEPVMVPAKSQLKRILLMGHGRGGSSFTGELFNRNKDASYWYEPDDAFFSYLAGFPTWHHASELYYPDATPRRLSESELEEMTKFLDGILSCDTSKMPTEVLVHGKGAQGKMNFAKSYWQCLKKNKVYTKRYSCENHIKNLCRYLPSNDKNECAASLGHSQTTNANSHANVSVNIPNTENSVARQRSFDKYRSCMSNVRTSVMSKCINLLTPKCKKTHIRAAKLLRFHVADVESMINMYPDIKIIHLMRDPRGIIASELKANKSRFEKVRKYEKLAKGEKLYQNEAKYVCAKLLIDYRERVQLQQLYPDNILAIKYEHIAVDPVTKARDIYRFLGINMPKDLAKWLYSSTHARSNNGPFDYRRVDANSTAYAWLKKGNQYRTGIAAICKDYLQAAGYTP